MENEVGTYKNNNGQPPKKREFKKNQITNATSVGQLGLSEIADVLQKIHESLRCYNMNSLRGDHSLNLITAPGSWPVLLELQGKAVENIAAALTRIADALTKGQHPVGEGVDAVV